MPKRIAPLTDIQIRNAKPKDKDYKIADGGGLYLFVTAIGGKLWRCDYRFYGKRKTLSFKAYPAISLVEARDEREKAKQLLAKGVDPGALKKEVAETKKAEQTRAALINLGYQERHSGHGWRATFRTIGDEVLNFRPVFIEHQLAHAVRDPNGRAYNRTSHLEERRKMMQTWADYLDKLKSEAKI